jgi:hypothetical protein
MIENYILAKSLTLKKYSYNDKHFPLILLGLYGLLTKYNNYKDIIKEVFLNTDIYILEENIFKVLKDLGKDLNSYIGEVDENETFYGISDSNKYVIIENNDAKLITDKPLIICNEKISTPNILLNTFIHEMSHLIKSNKNDVYLNKTKKEISYAIRSGLSFYYYKYNLRNKETKEQIIFSLLDEGINSLQTNDAMQEIKCLENIIPDENVNNFFKTIDFNQKDYGYNDVVDLLTPFWNLTSFKKIIEDNIIIGKITNIINYFDENIYKDSLEKLDKLLIEIDECLFLDLKENVRDTAYIELNDIYEKFIKIEQKVLK